MIYTILSLLSTAVTIFSLLCLIYIFLTWFPGAKFTRFGKLLTAICAPYMNFFSRITFLRLGNVDFSPIISIGILSILATTLSRIQNTGRLFIGGIFGNLLSVILSAFLYLVCIFFLLVFVRWISLIKSHGYTSVESGWNKVDIMVKSIVYRIAGTFTKSNLSYQRALLISWIATLVFMFVVYVLVTILIRLCFASPI